MNLSTLSRHVVSALAMVMLIGASVFGQTVATVPVGAVTYTLNPQSWATISLTLEESPVDYGSVSAQSTNTITDSSKNWTSGQFAVSSLPYVLVFTTGSSSGRTFLITSNTSNTITLAVNGIDITQAISLADQYRVVPVDTLGTLFPTGSIPFQIGASASQSDNVLVWDKTNSKWLVFFNNGTSWRMAGSGLSQDNYVLMPDQGLFVYRRAKTPTSFVITGSVPSLARKSQLAAGFTLLANYFPTSVTLSQLAFNTANSWQNGASASSSDVIYIWDTTGGKWLTFFNNGTSWRMSGSGLSQNSYQVAPGVAFFVKRQSSPSILQAYVQHSLPYQL